MRPLLVLLIVLAAGFDHAKHAGSTQQAIACTSCHAVTKTGVLGGRPGHAACFGACHGGAPTLPARGKKLVVEPARVPVCTTCHVATALATADRKAFAAAPPPAAPSFALAVGHKRHATVACAQCHSKSTRHERCAGCHVGAPGKGPAMTFCDSCHLPSDPVTTAVVDARPLVRTAFSHPKHAARGGDGTKCATCHAGVTETDARELPHPTQATCVTCHDGKAAFSTLTKCTRCHQDVPTGKYDVARPTTPFSHATHLAFVEWLPCTTCHAVEKSGEVGLAGHEQCAACHADDFGARMPTKCGACHDATEPWRKLLPDRPSRERSEFGASLDHATPKHTAACATCHSLTTATAQLRPPRGHRACSGTGCHATTGGARPALASCEACHELGLADRRVAERAAAEWSVRERFVHATHERARDGNALACTTCHVDMTGTTLMALATPPKATCAACHDGDAAFKLTGTGCARCHPGKQP